MVTPRTPNPHRRKSLRLRPQHRHQRQIQTTPQLLRWNVQPPRSHAQLSRRKFKPRPRIWPTRRKCILFQHFFRTLLHQPKRITIMPKIRHWRSRHPHMSQHEWFGTSIGWVFLWKCSPLPQELHRTPNCMVLSKRISNYFNQMVHFILHWRQKQPIKV